MAKKRDTIVAVSSPAGAGARAIVRLSGPEAFALAGRVFRPAPDVPPPGERQPYVCLCGTLALPGLNGAFDAMLFRMPAPASYTRDDVAELHVPGAPALVECLLEALASASARPAQPGEFTRRAVESGRIDLVQAEAVMKLISASGDASRRLALSELSGRWSNEIATVRSRLLDILVRVEGNIDFAEEDADLVAVDPLRRALNEAATDLKRMAGGETSLPSEPSCVLLGPPNAGKSMLFNRLCGDAHAVVTPVAGTTRDYIEGRLRHARAPIRLFDTAGAAEAHDAIEAGAQRHMRHLARAADLACFVLDGSKPLRDDWGRALRELTQSQTLVAVNKADLPQAVDAPSLRRVFGDAETFNVSARSGRGVAALRERIELVLASRSQPDAAELTLRQRRLVTGAVDAVERARGLLDGGGGFELMAVELNEAADRLRELSEPIRGDDVLERIFADFCIGK